MSALHRIQNAILVTNKATFPLLPIAEIVLIALKNVFSSSLHPLECLSWTAHWYRSKVCPSKKCFNIYILHSSTGGGDVWSLPKKCEIATLQIPMLPVSHFRQNVVGSHHVTTLWNHRINITLCFTAALPATSCQKNSYSYWSVLVIFSNIGISLMWTTADYRCAAAAGVCVLRGWITNTMSNKTEEEKVLLDVFLLFFLCGRVKSKFDLEEVKSNVMAFFNKSSITRVSVFIKVNYYGDLFLPSW